MKCPKCGEEYGGGVWFCDACGCDLRDQNQKGETGSKVYSGEENNYFEYQELQPLDKKKKKIPKTKGDIKTRLVSMLLLFTALAVVGLAGFFVYQKVHMTAYVKQVDRMVSLVNDRTTDVEDYGTLMFPKKIWQDMIALSKAQYEDANKDSSQWEKDANMQMKTSFDSMENMLGEEFKLDYEVVSERKLGGVELETIEKSYTKVSRLLNLFLDSEDVLKDQGKVKTYEAYEKLVNDFTKMDFTEGYELEVKFTLKNASDDKNSSQNVKLIVVKADGKWMIDFMHYIDALEEYLNQYLK